MSSQSCPVNREIQARKGRMILKQLVDRLSPFTKVYGEGAIVVTDQEGNDHEVTELKLSRQPGKPYTIHLNI